MSRYAAVGRDVWDLAWGDPATDTWTSGLTREMVCVRYPSEQAAIEAAASLNTNWNVPPMERLSRFTAACEAVIAEKQRIENLPQPREDWLDGIDLSDL